MFNYKYFNRTIHQRQCHKKSHNHDHDHDNGVVLRNICIMKDEVLNLVSIKSNRTGEIISFLSDIQSMMIYDEYRLNIKKEYDSNKRDIDFDLKILKNMIYKEKCLTENIIFSLNGRLDKLERLIKYPNHDYSLKEDNHNH